MAKSPQVTLEAAGREVVITNPQKVYFPEAGYTKLEVAQAGNYVEIEAQLRLAISDNNGRMLSFLSGGAKVQVPARTYNPKYLPNLRKEALENAMRGMFAKLLNQLRDKSQS